MHSQLNEQEKNKGPLISIIIPVYNAEKNLRYCLNSVVNQTYRNLEIILINDGSLDDSGKIIDEFASKDKRIVAHYQKNKGVSAARNNGISRASGDYISFIDSDDWVHPQMIEHLYEIIEKDNADISTVEIIRSEKEGIRDYPRSIHTILYKQDEYLKIFFKIGSQETVYYCSNKLYCRDTIENQLFPEFEIGEDVISTYKTIINSKRIVVSDAPLYYYRQNSGVTKVFSEKYFQLTKVWDEVIQITRERCPCYIELAEINRARTNFTLLAQMAITKAYKDKRLYKQKKELLKNLKRDRRILLKANIDIKRKIVIWLFCKNYSLSATIMGRFVRRQQ